MRRLDAVKAPPRLTTQLDAQIPKWHFAGELGRQKEQLKRVGSKVGSSFVRGSGKGLGSSSGTSPAHELDPELFASVGEFVEDSFSEGVHTADSDIATDDDDDGDDDASSSADEGEPAGERCPLARPYVRTNKTPGAAAREKQRTRAPKGFVVRGITTRWVTSETYYDEDELPYAKLAQRHTTPREEAAERKFYTAHGMRAAAAILATPQATAPSRGEATVQTAAAPVASSSEDITIDSSFKIAEDRDAATDGASSPEKGLPAHAPSRPAGRPMSARPRPQSARIPPQKAAAPVPAPLREDLVDGASGAGGADQRQAKPPRKTKKKKKGNANAAATRPMSADPRQRPTQAANALSAARKRAASDATAKRGASTGPRTALPAVSKPTDTGKAPAASQRPLSARSIATPTSTAAPTPPVVPAPPKRPATASAARPKGGQVPASTVTSEPAAAMTPPEAHAATGGVPAGRNDAIRAWQLDAGDPSMEPVSPPRRNEARREREEKHRQQRSNVKAGGGGGGGADEDRFHQSLLAQYRQQFQIV
jgi:hypothetical protein